MTTATAYRTNQYPGTCRTCRNEVPARGGYFIRGLRGWEVYHFDGDCPEAAPVATANPWAEVNRLGDQLPDQPRMHYAVPATWDDGSLRFFRIDKRNGGTFVRWVSGENNLRLNAAGQVQVIKAILAAGPDAAARLYGNQVGRCAKCHRRLTDETSRERGVGPDCAGMLGL